MEDRFPSIWLPSKELLDLRALRETTHSFSSLAGHSNPTAVTLSDTGEPHRVFAELVTANYFETLGLHPSLGRFFLPSEDVTPGSGGVAVLGYAAWQGRFGGAPDIIGRTIELNRTPFTIIGVGPKGFKGVYAVFGPDVWVPTMMADEILPAQHRNGLSDRAMRLFTGIGRLKPGVTLAQAQAEMKITASALEKEYPGADEGQSLAARPLTEAPAAVFRQRTLDGHRGICATDCVLERG